MNKPTTPEYSAAEQQLATPSSSPTELKLYGIYRQVSKVGSVAWRVSLARRGRSYARTFSVKRYGSNEAAVQAALAYRDKLVSEHAMVSRRENHVILRKNSHSGVPGVRLDQSRTPNRWVANIRLPDQGSVSQTFCVKKFGFEQAFELAKQARLQMLSRVLDRKTIRARCDPVLVALAPHRVVTDVVVPLTSEYVAPPPHTSSDVPGLFRFIYKRRRPDGSLLESPMWAAEYRWPDKTVLRRTYSIARFGEQAARQLALDQHAMWKEAPPPKPVKGASRKKRNGSRKPICSVQRKIQRSRSHGGALAYWQVIYRFTDDGQQRTATFSVSLYGEDGAYERAVERCQLWQCMPPARHSTSK
ncbi:AP2/ERF family transcription factor [Acidovorax kalamii]|uniref:AP2/ERF family transcription factor n=1 Tax=Acidovorax kalamii TaxID=2004485 RepID=UPI002090583E|nr:AP2 domain-containing protein [Acidovorax kalamii]